MAKRVFMPFFVNQYLAETFHITTAEHGAYLMLIMAYWMAGGSLPDDDEKLARIVKATPEEWKKIRPVLVEFFQVYDGRWWHRETEKKLEKVRAEEERHERALARKRNGKLLRPSAEVWAAIKREVLKRDNYTCKYCGSRGVKLECDHVIPLSKGGSNDHGNLVAACKPCNRSKGSKTVEQWGNKS